MKSGNPRNHIGNLTVTKKTRNRFLIAVVLIPLAVISLGVFVLTQVRGGLAFVVCDKNGLAFAKEGVPWMMTAEGPLRGDQPGALAGRQMTCDEVNAEFTK